MVSRRTASQAGRHELAAAHLEQDAMRWCGRLASLRRDDHPASQVPRARHGPLAHHVPYVLHAPHVRPDDPRAAAGCGVDNAYRRIRDSSRRRRSSWNSLKRASRSTPALCRRRAWRRALRQALYRPARETRDSPSLRASGNPSADRRAQAEKHTSQHS